jgi:hypothetical protein
VSFASRLRKAETGAPAESKPSSTSLRIGEPNDAYEQVAERVAGNAISGSAPRPEWSLSGLGIGTPLERGADSAAPAEAPPIVHEVLSSPGLPLEPAMRAFLEPKFGLDLGAVRIHADSKAADSAAAVQAQAYTVGRDIVLGGGNASGAGGNRRLLAHEVAHTLQQEAGTATVLQRQPAPAPELKLVDDFGAKFPAAAKLIKPNPAAMKLVKEAFDAGATFGGFAEDGPDKTSGRAYTVGSAVYVPKKRADPPVEAMSDFLFELNNAIRQPKYAALDAAAAAGKKTDSAAAKKYAHDVVEGEVEGMLRLGEVWFETKAKYLGKKAHDFDKYDQDFFLAEFQSFKDKKKTKEDIVQDVLSRKYDTGSLKGKTIEQAYVEEYQGLAQ